jgi:hypothetical protein
LTVGGQYLALADPGYDPRVAVAQRHNLFADLEVFDLSLRRADHGPSAEAARRDIGSECAGGERKAAGHRSDDLQRDREVSSASVHYDSQAAQLAGARARAKFQDAGGGAPVDLAVEDRAWVIDQLISGESVE